MSLRVVIVKKRTTYDLRGSLAESLKGRGFLEDDEYRRIVDSHKEHHLCLESLRHSLDRAKIHYEERYHETNVQYQDFDYIISVGGDGTLLEASHGVDDQSTIVGLRSSGTSVGHLCAGSSEHIEKIINGIVRKSLPSRSVMRIAARIDRASTSESFTSNPALNDILYTNANPAATTRYLFNFQGVRETHKSSGVWISTPVGSTAGMKAAGGAVMDRTASDAQYLVREPYQTESAKIKWKNGVFNPEKEELCIESRCEEAVLALDGLHETIRLDWGDRVTIKKSKPLKLAYL